MEKHLKNTLVLLHKKEDIKSSSVSLNNLFEKPIVAES